MMSLLADALAAAAAAPILALPLTCLISSITAMVFLLDFWAAEPNARTASTVRVLASMLAAAVSTVVGAGTALAGLPLVAEGEATAAGVETVLVVVVVVDATGVVVVVAVVVLAAFCAEGPDI